MPLPIVSNIAWVPNGEITLFTLNIQTSMFPLPWKWEDDEDKRSARDLKHLNIQISSYW